MAAQGGHSELIEVLIERYNCSASDRNEVSACMDTTSVCTCIYHIQDATYVHCNRSER